MTKTRCLHLAVALCAAIATGCSEGVTRQALTAPSPVTDTSATGNINGTVTAGADIGANAMWAAEHRWALAADGLVVEGTDLISAVADSCPAKTITVRGVPVSLTATTTFTAPVTCATLAAGMTVKVTALLTFTATGFTVTATHIAPAGASTPSSPGTKVEGVVASLTGTCPSLTITLQGAGGVIVTDTATVFDPGTLCGQIAPGSKIEALGTRNSTDQLVATKVELDTDEETPTGPGGGKGKKASGEGVIGSITGNCPTLTLVITGTKVSTTSTTVYEGGTCASLRPGTKVRIDGELNPGGTATAEKIEIKSIPPGNGGGSGKKVSGDGKVDTVSGTCPGVTMMVRGIKVTATTATTFSGGVCGDINPGSHIDVTGDYDGTEVAATAVHIRKK